MLGRFVIVPIGGIDYETQTKKGRTDRDGHFEYEAGESITFSIGGLVFGSSLAKDKLTPADLSFEVAGNPGKIVNRKVTNISRILLTLAKDGDFEGGFEITDKARAVCHKYRKTLYFNQPEDMFTADPTVQVFVEALGEKLISSANARNYLRRAMYNIIKMTDVHIPMRDGGYVNADIFLPEKEGRYPVIISFGGYGKAFWLGKECTDEEQEVHAQMEDRYFRGYHQETDYLSFHISALPHGEPMPQVPGLPPSGSTANPMLTHISETFERANVMDWVPDGYVVIFADSRGLGSTPGKYCQFGRPEANDYYDAIEWAGVQEWSNGNVGTYGGSFYAMNAFNVASLNPPHLKAFIPLAGDMDPYRDYLRFGGLMNKFGFTPMVCDGEFNGIDLGKYPLELPFDDEERINEFSEVAMRNTPKNIKIPFYTALSLEQAFIHTRGTSEIYINSTTPKENKYMDIVSEVGVHYWMYGEDILSRHKRFFAKWLKNEADDMKDVDSIHMMVRTGYGSYYWQDEKEWPIARTKYQKLYLHAADNKVDIAHSLTAQPSEEGQIDYPADQENLLSFVTEPFEKDTLLAGYFMAKLFLSSTSNDMSVLTYINVLDEDGDVVPVVMDLNPATPVTKGGLKISHRKLDSEKTTEYRPYHTHKKEDEMLLQPGQIVEADVEMLPATVLVKEGWRLSFGIMAKNQFSELIDDTDNYSEGATNTVYTGINKPSYIQIPVVD